MKININKVLDFFVCISTILVVGIIFLEILAIFEIIKLSNKSWVLFLIFFLVYWIQTTLAYNRHKGEKQ